MGKWPAAAGRFAPPGATRYDRSNAYFPADRTLLLRDRLPGISGESKEPRPATRLLARARSDLDGLERVLDLLGRILVVL